MDRQAPLTTRVNSTLIPEYTAQATTLCKGNTQIVGSLTQLNYSTTWGTGLDRAYPATITLPQTPSCSIRPTDCNSLSSADSSAAEGFHCSGTTAVSSSASESSVNYSSVCGGSCYISGTAVQVMYFPATATSTQDLCAASPTDIGRGCPYGTMISSVSTFAWGSSFESFTTSTCQVTTTPTLNATRTGKC